MSKNFNYYENNQNGRYRHFNNFRHRSYNFSNEYNNRSNNINSRSWRRYSSNSSSTNTSLNIENNIVNIQPINNQRDDLIDRIKNNKFDCMICVEIIRKESAIWHCDGCFNIFHIQCIRKWSKSCLNAENNSSTWRCPACQKEYEDSVKIIYECFCRKLVEPSKTIKYNTSSILPHSCGEVCGRNNRNNLNCPHLCTLICHPGPCPNCEASITGYCYCGSTQMTVKCNLSMTQMTCGKICNKLLNCGKHKCSRLCHSGDCDRCQNIVVEKCFCGVNKRRVFCGTSELQSNFESDNDDDKTDIHEEFPKYSCGDVCNKNLDCNNHYCQSICHPDECDLCKLSTTNPELKCPCGASLINQSQRQSCLDPIPICDRLCNRPYQYCAPHSCQSKCHHGDCPDCSLTSDVQCRCKKTSRNMKCSEIAEEMKSGRGIKCSTKCKARKTCGIHRCQEICCPSQFHFCQQVCNRPLSCGLHNCDQLCHSALSKCASCPHVSFQELSCTCGQTIRHPPIPCGSPLPECSKPCSIAQPCSQGHPSIPHICHDSSVTPCPPCTYLTSKACPKNHTTLHNIPCHRKVTTCGKPCGNPLADCHHKCIITCHEGPCPLPCTQTCNKPIDSCKHPCTLPCHPSDEQGCLASTKCTHPIIITCQCTLLQQSVPCNKLANCLTTTANSSSGSSFYDIIPGNPPKLSCNNECKRQARLKQLSDAFGVPSKDTELGESSNINSNSATSILNPLAYNYFLTNFSINNPEFLVKIDKEFVDLIRQLDTNKNTKVLHRFQPMNKEKRRFIHELSETFCLTSYSQDPEPHRCVIVEAKRGLCKIPPNRLLITMQRNYPTLFKPDPRSKIIKSIPISKLQSSTESYAVKMKSIKDLKLNESK